MYIACPECDTKFVVTPEQIGTHGRKVKCSKCSHVWHQKPANHVKIAPTVTATAQTMQNQAVMTPLGNGINLPALLPIRIPVYLYTMPALLLSMIIFMLITLFPSSMNLNSILDNREISIKDVQIDNHKDMQKIVVSYKVLNSAAGETRMPLVRVRLFDKNNRVLKSHIVDHSNIDLLPKQYVQIKTEFVPAPAGTESIDIMLGNKLDFILR
jgi:predicted Zn finger-like uncharacterized protein